MYIHKAVVKWYFVHENNGNFFVIRVSNNPVNLRPKTLRKRRGVHKINSGTTKEN